MRKINLWDVILPYLGVNNTLNKASHHLGRDRAVLEGWIDGARTIQPSDVEWIVKTLTKFDEVKAADLREKILGLEEIGEDEDSGPVIMYNIKKLINGKDDSDLLVAEFRELPVVDSRNTRLAEAVSAAVKSGLSYALFFPISDLELRGCFQDQRHYIEIVRDGVREAYETIQRFIISDFTQNIKTKKPSEIEITQLTDALKRLRIVQPERYFESTARHEWLSSDGV